MEWVPFILFIDMPNLFFTLSYKKLFNSISCISTQCMDGNIPTAVPPLNRLCHSRLLQPSLVSLHLVEVTERSLWQQQPWLYFISTGGGRICVCAYTNASHLLEDKCVNSPHTCCPSWIRLRSLSIHPATHVSIPSLSVSLHPSIHPSFTHQLLSLSSGTKRYLNPCYLTLTGPQSNYTCVSWLQVECMCLCACLWGN